MKQYRVGIVGATGMVGQRFATLLANHPWFQVTALAASHRSSGKPYAEAVNNKWCMETEIPPTLRDMIVLDAVSDVEKIASAVDFVFCAVDMNKEDIRALEERYAKAECPVVSNNSAHRQTPDVPMVIPELNAQHLEVIPAQKKRLGTKHGFIAVKSNCSLQSYVPALFPLSKFGVKDVLVCTYQAISGAGKTFDTWPEMVDNIASGTTIRQNIVIVFAPSLFALSTISFGIEAKKLRIKSILKIPDMPGITIQK